MFLLSWAVSHSPFLLSHIQKWESERGAEVAFLGFNLLFF